MKTKVSLKKLVETFLMFFKLGVFSIGGGPTMLTLLHGELVEKKKWLTEDELMEMTAISESTPGPIAINLATYLGYKRCGFLGALAATLGVIITPFTLMFIISLFLNKFLEYKAVQYAFLGIKAGVIFLLLKVGYTLYKNIKKDRFGKILIISSTILLVTLNIYTTNSFSLVFILISAFLGILVYGITPKNKGDKK